MDITTEADSAPRESIIVGGPTTTTKASCTQTPMLPPKSSKECVYMTSEDETDDDTTDSISPDSIPIKMTLRVHKDNLVTMETPPHVITECVYVTAEAVPDSDTKDSTRPENTPIKMTTLLPANMIADPEMPTKIVKECVYVMLNRIINKMSREACNGCMINHPSQLQHPCLFESPSDYYVSNKAAVKKRLYCLGLLRVLEYVCEAKGIKPNPLRMMGSVDMFMLEREENEEADDQMDDPYKSIDTDTAAIITAAIETCR